jgi:endonuclease YncB( thermonuclease family)
MQRNEGWVGHELARRRMGISLAIGLLLLAAALCPRGAFGGDVFYGKAVAVKSADLITVDYGQGKYEVRLAGVVAPREGADAAKAKQFVENLVMDKDVRARFDYRNKSGEMISRLYVGIPGVDVGIELLKAGLARKQTDYDYKYGELAAAENEARKEKRGLWAREPAGGTPPTRPRPTPAPK